MPYSITSNYAGEHAGQYISAALKQAKSLEYLTVLENIKGKRNITKVSDTDLVRDAACDFTDYGTLTLAENVLDPKELQINIDLCKKDLLADWQAAQMSAGAWNRDMSSDFAGFVMSHLANVIANATETSVWSGSAGTAGQFNGFATSYFGSATTSSASAAYSATNIVANLQTLVSDMPSAVYARASEDLYLYMNTNTYRFYISAMSTLGYVNQYHMTEDYQPYFEGIKIAVVPGMADNVSVAAQKSNLFYGTDLLSDATEIKMLDMATLDGSDNVRVVVKWTGGVQVGIAADITYQT